MLRTITILIVVLCVFTAISALIPASITQNMDNAIQYFVGQVYALNIWFNVATLLSCIQLFLTYIGLVLLYVGMVFLMRTVAGK
jgi:hypothetical protein